MLLGVQLLKYLDTFHLILICAENQMVLRMQLPRPLPSQWYSLKENDYFLGCVDLVACTFFLCEENGREDSKRHKVQGIAG